MQVSSQALHVKQDRTERQVRTAILRRVEIGQPQHSRTSLHVHNHLSVATLVLNQKHALLLQVMLDSRHVGQDVTEGSAGTAVLHQLEAGRLQAASSVYS